MQDSARAENILLPFSLRGSDKNNGLSPFEDWKHNKVHERQGKRKQQHVVLPKSFIRRFFPENIRTRRTKIPEHSTFRAASS